MLELAQHIQAYLHKHDRPPVSLYEEMLQRQRAEEERERRREEEEKKKTREKEEKEVSSSEGKGKNEINVTYKCCSICLI